MTYPKFYKVEEWNHTHMRIDEWEFTIIKEMKGPQHVNRISINAIKFLKIFVNFYLEENDNSYIRVYDAYVTSLKIPCYLMD